MKELSYLELKKIVEELQIFVKGRVEQIYMPDRKELIFQIYIPQVGKKMLRFSVPNFMYITDFKPATDHPPGYGIFLRKKIKKSGIKSIEVVENQRIIKIEFEYKEVVFTMFIEFFLKGNVILCDENMKIISPLENQKTKDRIIRGGVEYIIPEKAIKPLENKLDDKLVKYLAKNLNMGGKYSKEICERLNLDKNKTEISNEEINSIVQEIQKLFSEKPKGFVYKKLNLNYNPDDKDNSEFEVVDITPFDLKIYNEFKKEELESYNFALNHVLTTKQKTEIVDTSTVTHNVKLNKHETILKAQEKKLIEAENNIKVSTEKGELIYANYQLITDILNNLTEARKTLSWKEIKAKLKDHKIIKQIDEKNGKIVLNLAEQDN